MHAEELVIVLVNALALTAVSTRLERLATPAEMRDTLLENAHRRVSTVTLLEMVVLE